MNTSFIGTVVNQVLIPIDHTNYTVVLPSKRAVSFLKKRFATQTESSVFLPQIISVDDFIENISGLKLISDSELLFYLFGIYKENPIFDKKDSFEDFLKWGNTLIQDFNEVDRYLLNPKSFFYYLKSIQDLNHWSFNSERTELTENYLTFWNNLYQLYSDFTELLKSKKVGYQGLIYRMATEQITSYVANNNFHYFVGFNALNKAEKKIIQAFKKENKGRIIFDVDEFYINDYNHSAGLFIRDYEKNFLKDEAITFVTQEFTKDKNVDIVSVPKNISQVKYISAVIERIKNEQGTLDGTAVVLADEGLLIPLLRSLPANTGEVNITMGVQLSTSPFSGLLESFFKLHIQQNSEGKFYFKHLLGLINQSELANFLGEKREKIISDINTNNLVYVSKEYILNLTQNNPFLNLILTKYKSPSSFIIQLIKLIDILKEYYIPKRDNYLYELTCLSKYNEILSKIELLEHQYSFIDGINSLFKLYKDALAKETLDLQGNAANGLQIMGMLETRMLDFENIIMTSVNEGVLPSGKSNSSFITYDMKVHYELPTFREKDAIYSYHFYRLLQRAKNVHLLYNSEVDALGSGEESRFITQLKIYLKSKKLSKWKVKQFAVSPKVTTRQKLPLTISKTKSIQASLQQLAEKGFSPSALSSYIRNPIDFYHQKILGVKQQNLVEETIALNTLGTVIHNSLEHLYTPYVGTPLRIEHVDDMLKKADSLITKEFENVYKKGNIKTGKNFIIYKVATKYISNFLNQEKRLIEKGNETIILFLEKPVNTKIEIENINHPIFLKGIVDRIDKFNGVTRIIDYKTGKVTQPQLEVYNWDLLTEEDRFSKAFQILMYAYMMRNEGLISEDTIAGIISFKNLKNWVLQFSTKASVRASKKDIILTNQVFLNFEKELKRLILEIYNENIPFIEKET